MNNKSDQEFLERSRANFDRSVEALDSQTLARLTKARRAALADLEQTAARPLAWGWLTAGAVATLAAITVTTLLWVQQPASPTLMAEGSEDLDILLADDDPELYADLDFYTWLEAQHDGG